MIRAALPGSIHFLVRGWLNCNQILLMDEAGHVLVDSGYVSHAQRTLSRLTGPDGLGEAGLARLVNTHCHSDHVGGNAAVIERYGCRVTIPLAEAAAVDDWTAHERWNAYVDQEVSRFRYDDTLAPGDTFRAGGLEWEAHAAPGHDMEALMFFERTHRILISGDALWENGLGFVWPQEPPNPFMEAALATIDRIESLAPRIVLPGHGEPFEDVAAALGRARSRLGALAADPRRNARHMMKVMFVFSLLHRESMSISEVDEYVQRVPCYRDLNERFVGADLATLGKALVTELAGAGAVRVDGERVFPAMAA